MQTRGRWMFSLFLLAVGGVFYFTRLDNWFLGLDEANAALLAENILRDGLPTVADGRNIVWPDRWDVSPTRLVWILWGWLPLYVNALVFWLFGVSTFTARAASAALACLALPLVYGALKKNALTRGAAEGTCLLLVFSVPLTLFVRQCGYYTFSVYSAFGLFYSYFLMEASRKRSIVFVLFSLALVNTHLLSWGVVLAALALADLWNPAHLKKNLGLFIVAGLSAIPFLALYEVWTLFNRSFLLKESLPLNLWGRFMYYARFIHECILPGEVIAVLGLGLVLIRRRLAREERLFLAQTATFILVSLLLTARVTFLFFNRYVLYVLPVFFLISTLTLIRLWRWNKTLGACLFVLVGGFSVLGLNNTPLGRPSFLLNFYREISQEQTDLNKVLATYLAQNAKPDDVVVCNYEDLPLQFYTPCLIRGGAGQWGLRPEKTDPALGIHLVEKPDYIVFRRHWPKMGGDKIIPYLQSGDYEVIHLPAEDTPSGNREDPNFHYFTTPVVTRPFPLFKLKQNTTS